MRILVITNYYPPFEIGGWEQLAADVVTRLRERGHEVCVLTSRHRAGELPQPEPNVTRSLYLLSPDHFYYRPTYTLKRSGWDRANSEQLRQIIDTFAPDIVFINGMWNLSPAVAEAAEKRCGQRVIYYMANKWPIEPDPDSIYWSLPTGRALVQPLKSIAHKARQLLPINLADARRLAFPRVLCVSEFIRRAMVDEVGIPEENTFVVHNGIDIDDFAIEERDMPHAPLKLLYAGSVIAHKGVETAVLALGHLAQRGRLSELELTIAGSGHPSYEDGLRKLVEDLGLEASVTFTAQRQRGAMPALLVQHDVLIFPSTWDEPLARMVQEAMASGMVVIGTNTGGTPEILHDGVNGLAFPPYDDKLLADKIEQLLDNPEQIPNLVAAARDTVATTFTLERMVDALEEHFHAMLAEQELIHD